LKAWFTTSVLQKEGALYKQTRNRTGAGADQGGKKDRAAEPHRALVKYNFRRKKRHYHLDKAN
jgi:hypothetical protein